MTDAASRSSAAIARRLAPARGAPGVVYRRMGDRYLLVEYGDIVMDVNLRIRVHSLQEAIRRRGHPGIEETNPGVRSLLIKYDSRKIGHEAILAELNLETLAPRFIY